MAAGGSAVWASLSHITGLQITLYSDQSQRNGSALCLQNQSGKHGVWRLTESSRQAHQVPTVMSQNLQQQEATADAGDDGAEQQPADRAQHTLLQSTAAGFQSASCAAQPKIGARCNGNVAVYIFWQAAKGLPQGRTLCYEALLYIIRWELIKVVHRIPVDCGFLTNMKH